MSLSPFRIISWDVGIIHLAYCVLEINYLDETSKKKPEIKIIDWDEINLIEDDRITLTCSGRKALKSKSAKDSEREICGNNARFYIQPLDGSKMIGYCKTHLGQHADHYDDADVENLFVENKPDKNNICFTCSFKQKNSKVCGKKSKYTYTEPELAGALLDPEDNVSSDELYLCPAHYKSELIKKKKLYSPQPIKNLIAKNYPTAQLQLNLIVKLDSLAEHFAKLDIKEVVIENQPVLKNPKMKSIANTLFDYFMMRGVVDKIHGLDISMVKLMAASNKLKLNNDNTISVFKNNKDDKKKYKITKDLGIQYTKKLLENDLDQLEYLESYKKKDDMCDAYLQGRYYLEIYRKKNITNLEKNFNISNVKVKSPVDKKSHGRTHRTGYISGSKTTKSKRKKTKDKSSNMIASTNQAKQPKSIVITI